MDQILSEKEIIGRSHLNLPHFRRFALPELWSCENSFKDFFSWLINKLP